MTRTKEQDQAIARTLMALVEHSKEHLVLLQQSKYCLWVITKKHPTDPTKWPPAPMWPMRWVVLQQNAAGEWLYVLATNAFSDMLQRPQGRTAELSKAYLWRDVERAQAFAEKWPGAIVLSYQEAIERMVGVTVAEAAADAAATSDALVAEQEATTMSAHEEVADG